MVKGLTGNLRVTVCFETMRGEVLEASCPEHIEPKPGESQEEYVAKMKSLVSLCGGEAVELVTRRIHSGIWTELKQLKP